MNDKYTIKIIIKYKYSKYCLYWFQDDMYREIDILVGFDINDNDIGEFNLGNIFYLL